MIQSYRTELKLEPVPSSGHFPAKNLLAFASIRTCENYPYVSDELHKQ